MDEEDYKTQIRNLEIMLIAAVRSCGGRIAIPDIEIIKVAQRDEIHRFNDAKNRCVVLESNASRQSELDCGR